ncbi:MAG: hypothetical protein ACRD0W_18240 [Acidimicrobiales bacterium]
MAVTYEAGPTGSVWPGENAAGAVLSGRAHAVPKTTKARSKMIRQIKVAKDIAVKPAPPR